MTETKHSGCYICRGRHPQPEALASGLHKEEHKSVAVCDHPDCRGEVDMVDR